IGTIIRLDSATDPDLGLNAIHGYELEVSTLNSGETTNPFQLVVTENIDGTKIPQLQLSETLDREVTSSYELLLKAIDGGTPRLTGTATIEITVTDSNDNQPTFPRGSYVVEVPEDRPEGFMVIQVQATDLDSGTNADLTYSFPSLVSAHDKAIFRLDPDSGEISVKEPGLDYENRTIHHLTVEARDKGPNSSPAYTTVTVQVVDVNDEYPQIVINFMDYLDTASQDDTPSEATNMAKGTYIAFVTITDRDTGVNGNVTCRLKDSKDFELYELDKKESRYLIKTNKTLDRETKPFYNLKIEAWDFGSPSLTNTTIIAVELEDVNDNPPTFRQPSYTVGVGELIRNGRKVTQIKATDEDDGLNARITYTIQPVNENENLPFNIEQDTGIVRFGPNAEPLDADISTKAFLMTVTATDNGTPPLSATNFATVQIYLIDINDNPP
uniref:Cadherin domain-containing protein n=1 Tax=Ciona savignyi TaxID=51511 RepID=H2YLZ1_CIOSA